ncbi:CdaR family protein [Aquibacillus saliphilus]|uniref:CdaR family protein n=1 Tax=Aquibacillus saliphilus TaxID=1909422 RepID=UPI001CEFBD4A|nr:CdaR family protein [Aquibacillus saliphilus]
MDNWLKSPWVIRFVSLALAILLYTTVSLSENSEQSDAGLDFSDVISSSDEVQTIEDVPVDIKIDEEKYVVSNVPQTVSVTLEGSYSNVTSTTTQRNFDVFVDLQGLEPGTYMIDLQHSGISDNLDVYIEPKEIEVIIEEKATKEHDVTIDYINEDQIESGFEVGDAKINPAKVTITSSKGVVEKIAVVKAFINLQGVDKPIENREAPVKVYDSEGNELSVRVEPATVEVSVDVRSPSKVVPIEVPTTGEAEEGITINSITSNPTEVRVFASDDVLKNIESIKTDEIDLSEITEATTVELQLNAPEDIRRMETEQVDVNIQLERTEERVFNLPIEIENLDEDYSLTFVEPTASELSLTAFGLEEELSNLSNEDFQVSINMEEYQEGEFEIPVEIVAPEGLNFDVENTNVLVRVE